MPTLKLDADAKAGVKAFNDLDAAVAKVDKTLALTAKEARQLDAAAMRIAENVTPQRKYNSEMEKLGKLVGAGKLQLQDAQLHALKLEQRLHGVGKAGDKAFGAGMLSNIAGMAAGYMSIGAAIGFVTKGLSEAEAQQQKFADSFFNSLGNIGEMQLISDDPKDFMTNMGRAHELVRRGIVGEEESYGIASALKSGGFSKDEVDAVIGMAERKQIAASDIENTIRSGKKVANLYAGQGLSFDQILDRLGVAAGPGDSTSGEFAKASTQWGQQAAMLGWKGDEGLAAQMVAEKYAGSIDMAGTQLGEFMNQAMKRGLAKATLTETVQGIDAMVAGGMKETDVLEGNALKAYSSLSRDKALMGTYQKDLAAANGYMDTKFFLNQSPEANAALMRSKAEGRLADAMRSRTTERELLHDSLVAEYQARPGTTGFGRFLTRFDQGMFDFANTEHHAFKEAVTDYREQLSPELVKSLEDYMRRTAEATERLERNNNGGGTTRQE